MTCLQFVLFIIIPCNGVFSGSLRIPTSDFQKSVITASEHLVNVFNDKPCFGGLHCIHGHCRRKSENILVSECVCDIGWMGLVCDQRVDVSNFEDNHNGLEVGRLARESRSTSTAVITTPPSNVGKVQNIGRENDDGADDVIVTNNKVVSGDDNDNTAVIDNNVNRVCDNNYIPRTLTERTCTLGLLCRFGTCTVDHQDTYIAYTCHCDKGAVGIFCEHKCCLDCGTHGSCHLFHNGTQFCNCHMGYHDKRCQEKQTGKQAKKQTMDNGEEEKISRSSVCVIRFCLSMPRTINLLLFFFFFFFLCVLLLTFTTLFSYFFQKTGFNISSKLYPLGKLKYFNMSSAAKFTQCWAFIQCEKRYHR